MREVRERLVHAYSRLLEAAVKEYAVLAAETVKKGREVLCNHKSKSSA